MERKSRSLRLASFLLFLITTPFITRGQTTPDNIPQLQLWLDASDATSLFQDVAGTTPVTADNQTVRRWADKSGNNHHATMVSGKKGAVYNSDAANLINGKPVLRFNKDDEMQGSVFVTDLDVRSATFEDITIFTVYRPRSSSTIGQGQAIWGNDNGAWDRFFYTLWSSGFDVDGIDDGLISLGGASQGLVVANSGVTGETYTLAAIFDGNSATNSSSIYFDGKQLNTFRDQSDPTEAYDRFFIGWDGDNGTYGGDIAEIIVYSKILDECELASVNVYLGEKYGKDFLNIRQQFGFSSGFPKDVNGLGVFVADCNTSEKNSASVDIVKIDNPSSNNTVGEFMTFGHNNGGLGSSTNIPGGVKARLNQVWRVDEDGDLGTVDITFDLRSTGMDESTDASDFVLLVDSDDGNFDNATSHTANLTYDAVNNLVMISGYDFNHGDYFTLGVSTSVELSINSPAAVTEGGDIIFTVTADNNVQGDVVVGYAFADVTTSAADFTGGNASGTVTITDGTKTASITLQTNKDAVNESTESFTIELTGIVSGLATISSTAHTGTGSLDNHPLDDDGDGILTDDEDVNGDEDPTNDDSDGDGVPNYLDTDDDGDGIPTSEEDLSADEDPTNDDSDADGIPNYLDADDDGDGVPTSEEDVSGDDDPSNDDSDNDGVADYLDADDDGDGVPTSEEDVSGDDDPSNDDSDGDGVPNYRDADDDGDGIPTSGEDVSGDDDPSNDDNDGDGVPNYRDADDDGDGVPTSEEDVSGDDDPSNDDSDNDGVADYLDADDDGDGVPTSGEDVNGDDDPSNDDNDGDGVPNYRDADDDGDGIPTSGEDVSGDDDPSNDDSDGDGVPNYRDADDDGDGVPTSGEDVSGDNNPSNDDSDNDGVPNYLDADDDGDGVPTGAEDVSGDSDPWNDDSDGDGVPNYLDSDDDGDGVPTSEEDMSGDGDPSNDDSDGDGVPNYLDSDDDGDGIPTKEEDTDGNGSPLNDDTDGDGIPDAFDDDADGDGLPDSEEDDSDCDGDGIPARLDNEESCGSEKLKIPQGLSPNGDGNNEAWIIEGIERFPGNSVRVYNRWGSLVFEARGYNNESIRFTGYSNSKGVLGDTNLPDGTYFYVIDFGDGTSRKGYIILKREN